MKKITCLKCLTYMIAEDKVRVNFCFSCGSPVNIIPKDAHKDFVPDLSGKSHRELQTKKNKKMSSLLELREYWLPGKLDWEKKDWFDKLKKL